MFRYFLKFLLPIIVMLTANIAAIAWSGATTAFAASQQAQAGQEVVFLPNPPQPPKDQNSPAGSQSLEPSGSDYVLYRDWVASDQPTPQPKDTCNNRSSTSGRSIIIGHRFMRFHDDCNSSPTPRNMR